MGLLVTDLTRSGAPIFVTELITPDSKQICDIYEASIGSTREETIWNCWNYICTHLRYKYERGDIWSFPFETLWRKYGDCEDSSFALCSLLRHDDLMSPEEVWVSLGTYGLLGEGHAWVTILLAGKRWVMETTLSRAPEEAVAETYPHSPWIYINDTVCIELKRGFKITKRNAAEKVRQIEQFYNIKVRG